MRRILLLEDDLFTSRMIKVSLEGSGRYIVSQSFDISSAFHAAAENQYDLAIFDVQLPSGSSLDSFVKLKNLLNCPVIVYTAKDSTKIELKSLDIGAEDFLLKQRGVDVLIRRINRLLPSEAIEEPAKVISANQGAPISIDQNQRILIFKSYNVVLTKTESNILSFILSNDNYTADREELSFSTKGYAYDGWSRSLDLAISRLRKKLNTETEGALQLRAIRGKGYKLEVS